MYNFRTDLAVERNDIYKHQNNLQNDADGIEVENEEKGRHQNIKSKSIKWKWRKSNRQTNRKLHYFRYKKYEINRWWYSR